MNHRELFDALREMPVFDVHTHINRDHMHATGLDQVMFYHMQMYPARAAGVDENRMWPEQECIERGLPYDQFLKAWPKIRHSGFGWMLQNIFSELYGFEKDLSADTLDELREHFDARRTDPLWAKHVFDKCNIVKLCSSVLNVQPWTDERWTPPISFTIEDAPSCGKQDFLSWKDRLAEIGQSLGRVCKSVQDIREATAAFYDQFEFTDRNAVVAWLGAEADFTPAPEHELNRIIADVLNDSTVSLAETRLLEGAALRAICDAVREKVDVFQFCYGTQYVTPEPMHSHPIAKAAREFAQTFPYILGEYPDLHFNCLNGYELDEPIWCGMTQGYGNISLANYWWQCFYPSVMRAGWSRRLDMAPLNRLIGFFSDGWCLDYVFGRLDMVRWVIAGVLADRIASGRSSKNDALAIARRIFLDTPREIFAPGETF